MVLERNVLIWYILTIIILYILQGVITGFGASIPIYLRFYKASWQEQGTYSWVSYPFSFKILWAPIIDSVYSRRFGRNQTWLIPIQLLIGIILIILSFYLEYLLVNLQIILLTLFKKRCMQQLILILITGTVSYGATYSMTNLTLLEYGVKRETLGLLRIPLVVVDILVPLCLNRIRSPLGWFARGYILRLISSVILAIYIFFTPRILHTSYFYPILIILLCLNEAFIYIMVSSGIGFYARISDPRIAGTYMTLLVSVGNLGLKLSSTLALYIANWLPKTHAYSIEVGACFILGCIWIKMAWNILKHLDALPVEEWYLTPSKPIHCYLEQEEEE
ncbi:unnamed protein product [Rotaria sordida]|uniref:Uncharacterized protein n=1 Tax=Rotaria sordida TaxID=392033 RepID=A0A814WFY4_9BILA|nr:unnamed protein product [Rotaria sordida]